MSSILFVVAHPRLERSRVNSAVLSAVQDLDFVTTHLLYDVYPRFHIHVSAEQRLIEKHAAIVLQHPFYWYSIPPLLKLWLDEVFLPGWAYGEGGHQLRGKQLLISTSTGGEERAYSPTGANHFSMETLLSPMQQTARLCQLRWLSPSILHHAHRATEADVEKHAEAVRRRLIEIHAGAHT